MLAPLPPALTMKPQSLRPASAGVSWLLTWKSHVLEPTAFSPQTLYLGIIFSASPLSLVPGNLSEFKKVYTAPRSALIQNLGHKVLGTSELGTSIKSTVNPSQSSGSCFPTLLNDQK